MLNKKRLLTPGPTPLPEEVRLALAQDMIHHRKGQFKEIMQRVQGHLRELFGTTQPVLPLSCSGSGAMTAAVYLNGEKLAEQKADVRVLVNNAGCGTTGNIGSSASPADVMRVVDLNVRALTMVTQTVVPFMTRGAKIINVSSIAAFCPTPRMTVYSASKAYVSAFTGGIADELRPKGISVTAVCPGPMKTEFFDAAGAHDLFGNIPWCDPVKVVAGTIRAAKKGRTFYTPTAFNKFYRFVAKILPMKWMIKATRV